jgi:hypothetical protein
LDPIWPAGFTAYGHTPAIICGGIPKEEVGTYPGSVLNRFLGADVIVGDGVANTEAIAPEFQMIGTLSAEKTVRAWE